MNTEYHHHACQEQCLSYLKADEKERNGGNYVHRFNCCMLIVKEFGVGRTQTSMHPLVKENGTILALYLDTNYIGN